MPWSIVVVSPVRSSHPAATAAAVQKIIAARTAAVAPFLFFFFSRFLFFGAFYLEFSVKTAISPSFKPFSILAEVLDTIFLLFLDSLKNNILKHVEISTGFVLS